MTQTCTAAWSADDLALFGGAAQVDISTRRPDDSLRPFVPIWIVAVDGTLYVRSYRGADGAWYRLASTHPDGAIRTNGVHREVTFTHADPATNDAVDAAYRAKCGRYGASYLTTMLGDRLSPRP